jgi:hypothetical protein
VVVPAEVAAPEPKNCYQLLTSPQQYQLRWRRKPDRLQSAPQEAGAAQLHLVPLSKLLGAGAGLPAKLRVPTPAVLVVVL